jgi:catechol-2,3-dioxygenase
MDSLDDYFEYALDLPEAQREQLLAGLRADEPELAARLATMLRELVTNPDFAVHGSSLSTRAAEPAAIEHVTLAVADVARAVEWYHAVFRCRVVARQHDRAVLAFANLAVHLVADGLEPPSLTVSTADVQNLGATERRPDGARALRLVDPWGNAIEVVESHPPPA